MKTTYRCVFHPHQRSHKPINFSIWFTCIKTANVSLFFRHFVRLFIAIFYVEFYDEKKSRRVNAGWTSEREREKRTLFLFDAIFYDSDVVCRYGALWKISSFFFLECFCGMTVMVFVFHAQILRPGICWGFCYHPDVRLFFNKQVAWM